MVSRYDLEPAAVVELLSDEPPFRARQLWDVLYRHHGHLETATVLPKSLRQRLATEPALGPALREVARSTSDGGATVKWLWALDDDRRIETVLMHYRTGRSTVCVSSQAGCAMACGFCATGQAGFDRHLTTGEIVEQVVRAAEEAEAAGGRLSNVVFMGMGEPLANYDHTWAAVERVHGHLGLSARHVTISTVGIVPGIRRLAAEALPVTLAVSLHAANDELRNELVPINRRYPIAAVVDACERWRQSHNRRLTFEWALIDGVNDRDIDARQLAPIARRLGAHVNLIPLNPTPGWPTRGSPPARVKAFQQLLEALGANATVRRTRGSDIDAACGQLRAAHEAEVTLRLPD